MNRTQIAGIFVLAISMMIGTTAAQPTAEQVQAELGDTSVNSMYAYDSQGNFLSVIFTEDGEARHFGTEGGMSELDPNSSQICFQYTATTGDGVFGGLFGGDGTTQANIDCMDLQTGNETQIPQMPQMPQMNQTQNQTQENQTQQGNMTPSTLYAYDGEGDFINVVLNEQGEVTGMTGSVPSWDQLQQGSTVACEYFLEGDSEVRCYDGQGFQERIENGSIDYLSTNMTQQNQTQRGGEGIYRPR